VCDKDWSESESGMFQGSISNMRIEFHQVQQCFINKIKPLHVSANDGHYRKATNTSK
jgi:hypothetical protein